LGFHCFLLLREGEGDDERELAGELALEEELLFSDHFFCFPLRSAEFPRVAALALAAAAGIDEDPAPEDADPETEPNLAAEAYEVGGVARTPEDVPLRGAVVVLTPGATTVG
jgi:hypothetical protein